MNITDYSGKHFTFIGLILTIAIISIVVIGGVRNYGAFRNEYSNRDKNLEPATMIGFDFDLFVGSQIASGGFTGSLEIIYIPDEGKWFEYFSVGGAAYLGSASGAALAFKWGRVYNLRYPDDYKGAFITSTGRIGGKFQGIGVGGTGFLYTGWSSLKNDHHKKENGGYDLFGKRVHGWAIPYMLDINLSSAISPISGSYSVTSFFYSNTGMAEYLNHRIENPSQDDNEFISELECKATEIYSEAERKIRSHYSYYPRSPN